MQWRLLGVTCAIRSPSRKRWFKLFLLIGNVADEFTQALTAYGLAKKAGLKHVTYLSVYQANRFLDVPHFAAKHAVEEAIREGGVPYTILRPGYFMQNDRHLKP